MSLPSLLLGLIIGGLLMWLADWFFYGQLHLKGHGRIEELQERLADYEEELDDFEKRLATSESLRHTADAELVTARADSKQAQERIAYLERQLSIGKTTK
jgi:F0F1-type ATP synthase membrane subunit b/b'